MNQCETQLSFAKQRKLTSQGAFFSTRNHDGQTPKKDPGKWEKHGQGYGLQNCWDAK